MGYNITYGTARVRTNRKRTSRLQLGLTVLFFGLFCAIARRYWAEEVAVLGDLLLPQTAVQNLIEDLQAGESIAGAVSAFCETVIYGR